MKRILACLLILVMIFAFAACTSGNEESKPAGDSSTVSVGDKSEPASTEDSNPEESSTAPVESSDVEESSTVVTPPPVREEAEEPSSYIWLSNSEGGKDTALGWKIDASAFEGKSSLRIFADVKFEDIVSIDGGLAFVNIYFYGEDGNLIEAESFEDWASSRDVSEDEMGKWYSYEYNFEMSQFESDDKKVAYVTVTIGFWNATGKIYCGPLNISANKEMFWGQPFDSIPDFTAEDIFTAVNMDEANSGLTWEVVFETQPSVGTNLAAEDGVTITLVNGEVSGTTDELKLNSDTPYGGSLNDGRCGTGELGNTAWFGFHPTKTLAAGQKIDEQSGQMGTVVIDLGSEQEFNRVRAYHWSPNEYGIASLIAARAYYSDDGEEWTEYNDLLINSEDKVGWADTDVVTPATARYVKVEFLFATGAWGMISEIEVISAKQDVVE